MEKHGRSALRSISTKIAAWCMVGLFLATSFAMIGDVSATNPSGSPLPIVASGNIDSLNEFSPCATFQDTIEKLGSTYYLIFENGNNLCYRTTTDLNSSWSGTDVSFFAIGATHIPYMVALTKTAGGSDEIGNIYRKIRRHRWHRSTQLCAVDLFRIELDNLSDRKLWPCRSA